MSPLIVVVGAGRPLGVELIHRLALQGAKVRAVVVEKEHSRETFPEEVEVVAVEPNPESVAEQCADAALIYNCFEPLRVRGAHAGAEMTTKILLAAIEHGSKLVLVSYLFNSVADNRAAESDVLSTHRSGLTKTQVVRFPQMYGPTVSNALFDDVFESVLAGRKAYWLGTLDAPRSYVYLSDAAAALALISSSETAFGEAWNVAGPEPLTGRQFIGTAFEVAGRRPQIGCWGRGLMITARVLDQRSKKLADLPYNYYSPFILDGSRLASAFPTFKFTPHREAMRETLDSFARKVEAVGKESPAS